MNLLGRYLGCLLSYMHHPFMLEFASLLQNNVLPVMYDVIFDFVICSIYCSYTDSIKTVDLDQVLIARKLTVVRSG